MFEPLSSPGSRIRFACIARISHSLAVAILFFLGFSFVAAEGVSAQIGGKDFLFRAPRATLSARVGYAFARAGSDVFDDATTHLTLKRSDFSGVSFAADLGLFVTDHFDVVLGGSYNPSGGRSEYVEYVEVIDGDSLPIEQNTALTRVPLTVSARFYPMARGRSIGNYAWIPAKWVPYAGAGVGMMYHQYEQEGDFVDFVDDAIFTTTYTSSGWSRTGHVFGGLEIALGRGQLLTAEARYLWGSGNLGLEFLGFDPIDLAGLQTMIGFSFRL